MVAGQLLLLMTLISIWPRITVVKKGASPRPFYFPVLVELLQLMGLYNCSLSESINRFQYYALVHFVLKMQGNHKIQSSLGSQSEKDSEAKQQPDLPHAGNTGKSHSQLKNLGLAN